MIPELGKYAAEVLSSYAVSLGLLAGLAWLSIWRGQKVKKRLEALEKKAKKRNG